MKPGASQTVAVLKLLEGTFGYTDGAGRSFWVIRSWNAGWTLRGGTNRHDPNGMSMPPGSRQRSPTGKCLNNQYDKWFIASCVYRRFSCDETW